MRSDCLLWDGLALSPGDAIYAHWSSKEVWPQAPTPLERFALGPTALLVAQSWAIPETPFLPSTRWWRKVPRLSDRALAGVVRRASRLVRGEPPLLDVRWREAWREALLPGLLEIVRERRQNPRPTRQRGEPPLDVLDMMRRLTAEEGRERRGEFWFRCPFHADRTPSLSVNPAKAVFKCFGCQEGGGWKRLKELAA